jgi:hypothetical protein
MARSNKKKQQWELIKTYGYCFLTNEIKDSIILIMQLYSIENRKTNIVQNITSRGSCYTRFNPNACERTMIGNHDLNVFFEGTTITCRTDYILIRKKNERKDFF